MYQKEKQILVTTVSTILIFGFYALYLYRGYFSGNPELLNDLQFLGKAFLLLIPVAIVAQIMIHIIFAIINKIVTREDVPDINDEMDKMIELKAMRVSYWIYMLGFVSAMATQAIGMAPYMLFIALFASCLLGAIAEGLTQIYYYRKGL